MTKLIDRAILRFKIKNVQLAAMICIIAISAVFLFYKINSYPNVYTDEGNGMYDSWCIAKYGTDSHLLKNPVYLPGYRGQGQSVLYADIAALFLKVFGYKLWAYRLPLLLICILNMIILMYVGTKRKWKKEVFFSVLAVATSPWMLTVARYGMDCNVAPFILSIASLTFYYGCTEREDPGIRRAWLIAGAVLFAAVCYSYNVSWIFMPAFMFVLLAGLIRAKVVTVRELILPAAIFTIFALPVMLFAVRSNVSFLNNDLKILWFTLPKLATGRASESFIDISDGIIPAIRTNLYKGIRMFANGTDKLSWNSPGNFGPYYMFTMPFFLQGLRVRIKRRRTDDIFVLSQLIGMIPIMLVVTPNYNHWIFLHFAVLFTIGTGLSDIFSKVRDTDSRRHFFRAVILTYAFFTVWFFYQYFAANRYTGWDSDSRSTLLTLNTDKYNKVYVITEQADFLENLRFALPVSPAEFQETKDNPYSETEYTMETTYSNFELMTESTKIQDHSLFLIQKSQVEDHEELLNSLTETGNFRMYELNYTVYEN